MEYFVWEEKPAGIDSLPRCAFFFISSLSFAFSPACRYFLQPESNLAGEAIVEILGDVFHIVEAGEYQSPGESHLHRGDRSAYYRHITAIYPFSTISADLPRMDRSQI